MKKYFGKIAIFALCSALLLACAPSPAVFAYSAPAETVRIGLYYGSSAMPSANLQNYNGFGSGYDFGYFDSDREFVSVGAYTSEEKITMMIDKNMEYDPEDNKYVAGTLGAITVGCFHIRLEPGYPTFDEAAEASEAITEEHTFIKYSGGSFYVLVGDYKSRDEAEAAVSDIGIARTYTIDSGSSGTVTVVKTGTSEIIFEYDGTTEAGLAVMPRMTENGNKPQTWFRGYRWHGGFQYTRLSSNLLTVVNFVNIEDYVKGVIPYEMSASWPKEALKAQAICARTYITANLGKHRVNGFDCCNTTDCQVYYGCASANANSDSAVDETAGQYLMYNGKLCTTFYHACDGGWTEDSANVWNEVAYLRAVEDIYETSIADSIPGYHWTKTYTGSELAERLRSKGYNCSTIVSFEVLEYTDAGNVYKIKMTDSKGVSFTFTKESCRTVPGAGSQRYTVSVSGGSEEFRPHVNPNGEALPQSLSQSYAIGDEGAARLPAGTLYAVTGTGSIEALESRTAAPVSSNPTFVISGTGSGHNVGMSQRGAYAMAKSFGKTCEEILTFYFQGTSVVTAE